MRLNQCEFLPLKSRLGKQLSPSACFTGQANHEGQQQDGGYFSPSNLPFDLGLVPSFLVVSVPLLYNDRIRTPFFVKSFDI